MKQLDPWDMQQAVKNRTNCKFCEGAGYFDNTCQEKGEPDTVPCHGCLGTGYEAIRLAAGYVDLHGAYIYYKDGEVVKDEDTATETEPR